MRRALGYLRPYGPAFLGALAQVLVITALDLLRPWPLKVVIDHVLAGTPVSWGPLAGWSPQALLLAACLGLVVIHAGLAGLTLWQNTTTIGIGQAMVNDLRRELFGHLQRMSLAFHHRREIGDLLYRVTSDTYAIQSLCMNGVFPLVSSLALLLGMFVVLVRLDLPLTLLALTVCPVLLLALAWLNARVAQAATQARQRESAMYTLVQRAMAAVRLVQAFTREREEERRFLAASRASLDAGFRLYALQTVYGGVVNIVIALGTALVVWVGARHVLGGTLTVGELVVFTSYLAALYAPLNSLLNTYGLVQSARAGVRRVFEVLDVERDLPEGARDVPPGGVRGDVAWEDVRFEYDPGQPVLRGVTLRVAAGATVAVVGPTGAGKSTLLSLVPRFYDPARGRVTVDGTDVRDYRLAALRRQVAMVLQPPIVLPGTIRDNIAYGRPGASPDAIVTAARLAAVHEFVSRLPAGYDTVIGEQGLTLSEGERLRIGIARAIVRDAPILILDEPTASVDAETEALIMRGLRRLSAGRTTFVIAHRLSTVRAADLVVVLRAGQIVEQGGFEELLRRGTAFAALYRAQFIGAAEGFVAAP